MNDQVTQIHKMLEALLFGSKQIHWIGGYAFGRTSNDDPFLILYPAQEFLKEKICRVYPKSFKRLPAFVVTDVPKDITNDSNPSRDKAIKLKIYRSCPHFKILTTFGKETQMGKEIRFFDTLWCPNGQWKEESPLDRMLASLRPLRPVTSVPMPAPDDLQRVWGNGNENTNASTFTTFDQYVSRYGESPYDIDALRHWWKTDLKKQFATK